VGTPDTPENVISSNEEVRDACHARGFIYKSAFHHQDTLIFNSMAKIFDWVCWHLMYVMTNMYGVYTHLYHHLMDFMLYAPQLCKCLARLADRWNSRVMLFQNSG